MALEEFRTIEGYEDYQVSNLGNVYSLKTNKILKPGYNYGYAFVNLEKNGKFKSCKIHRLVAKAFIDNPQNYPFINHKDENRANNNVNNLEWCDAKYNNNWGNHNLNMAKTKGKITFQYTLNNILVNSYYSANEASRQTGITCSNIIRCCNGERKTAGGYRWEWGD